MATPRTLDEANIRAVKIVRLIQVTFLRGDGSGPGHTMREVQQYWNEDGGLVVEVDDYDDEREQNALDHVLKCGWDVLRKDAPGYTELKPFNEAMNDYQRLTGRD